MSNPKPTQAGDGELDEILDHLVIGENPYTGERRLEIWCNGKTKDAKQAILALKSTWQAEARREMLEKLRLASKPHVKIGTDAVPLSTIEEILK